MPHSATGPHPGRANETLSTMKQQHLRRLEELEQQSNDGKHRVVVARTVTTDEGEVAIAIDGSSGTYPEEEFWAAVEANPGLVVIPADGPPDDWVSPHEMPLGMRFEDLLAVEDLRADLYAEAAELGRELTNEEREEIEAEVPRAAYFLREMERREAWYEAHMSKRVGFFEAMRERSDTMGWAGPST